MPERYLEQALFWLPLADPDLDYTIESAPSDAFREYKHPSPMFDLNNFSPSRFYWYGSSSQYYGSSISLARKFDSYMIEPEPAEEVIVTGIRASLANAADLKRESSDELTASDIGLVGDASALRRLASTGIDQAHKRTNFLDLIYWNPRLKTDSKGKAKVTFKLPDNTTQWAIDAWASTKRIRVGTGNASITVNKPLLLRMQTPRFLVEDDEVVLSANVGNFSEEKLSINSSIKTNQLLMVKNNSGFGAELSPQQEMRADWTVTAMVPGKALVEMSAESAMLSDTVAQHIPVIERGAYIQQHSVGSLGVDVKSRSLNFSLPKQRDEILSHIDINVSPYLVAPALKSLPYLADYPYGCSEQTLNRFLPSAVALKILKDGDFKFEDFSSNELILRGNNYPVEATFTEEAVSERVAAGLSRLANMQNSDGGWGWFGGGRSYDHATALVMHGLTDAKRYGVFVDEKMFSQGMAWLENNYPAADSSDSINAYMGFVLAVNHRGDVRHLQLLTENRKKLMHMSNIYLAWAFHELGDTQSRDILIRHLLQFLELDNENGTAYLRPKADRWGWSWDDRDIETQSLFARLLLAASPESPHLPRLMQYLLNRQGYGNYWESTRASAGVITALLEYHKRLQQQLGPIEVKGYLNGQLLFSEDFSAVLEKVHIIPAESILGDQQVITLDKEGDKPIYYSIQSSHYSKEEKIKPSGLELKVERKLFKVNEAIDEKSVQRPRVEINDNELLISGDIIDVELYIESKNSYEYLLIEDKKAAGFEAINAISGYHYDGLGAYVEYRDDRVSFFVQHMPRGTHVLRYRLRAETPGKFTALPATIEAMYAPELYGNSDSQKISIKDAK